MYELFCNNEKEFLLELRLYMIYDVIFKPEVILERKITIDVVNT